ncbi:hypothetical protein ACQEVB_14065 [Pseudonocardia sp. CA-107938]|uniref:hypothetical protein n=1 Tax=Pseudonocardia sp. CA-107938 TaxID=3240021 RepID=UPI003D92C1E7
MVWIDRDRGAADDVLGGAGDRDPDAVGVELHHAVVEVGGQEDPSVGVDVEVIRHQL